MKNLSLQGEVRHAISGVEGVVYGKIVSVIRKSNRDTDGDGYINHQIEIGGPFPPSDRTPTSYILVSHGYLLGLDADDEIVWSVDLEKIVATADDEEGCEPRQLDVSHRSQWFYSASFAQETTPGESQDGGEEILMDLGGGESLHVTCLSHAGHVVSVSIDSVNELASLGQAVEGGGECIGSFENGLQCGAWSPDSEVLALVTFASDDDEDVVKSQEEGAQVPILMTMNTQYDILAEVHLEPSLVPDHHADETLHEFALCLCWRPDSSTLAVSSMDSNVNGKPLRRIRTYNRTTLQILSLSKEEDGSGRDVPNLQPVAPTWAPAGCSHYIGAIQSSRPLSAKSSRRQISMQVAFMEPNGLRHRECKIHNTTAHKSDKEEIVNVAFNIDGDLLAVTSTVTAGTTQLVTSKVQFYHRSNYHWYLKYELRYDDAVITAAKFSDDDPHKATVALAPEENLLEWREYEFRWDPSSVYYRSGAPTESSCVVAMVVDGKTLQFTPLDKALVPPPMYAASVELPAPVVEVAARPTFLNEDNSKSKIDYISLLSNGTLALISSDGTSGSIIPSFKSPALEALVDIMESQNDLASPKLALRDLTIIDANEDSITLVAIACPAAGSEHKSNDIVVEIAIASSGETVAATIVATKQLNPLPDLARSAAMDSGEGRALRLVNWVDTAYSSGARGTALVELRTGSLLEYSVGGKIAICEAGPLLEACPLLSGIYDAKNDAFSNVSTIPNDVMKTDEERRLRRMAVGLSSRYRLYCGERLLSSASSSFTVSLEHRFITHCTIGSRPQLRFVPLEVLRTFDLDDLNAALDGYEPRNVERGSRLVAVYQSKPTVVIQMPRGNLETISPRGLLLPYVMQKIQSRDFVTSMMVMRKQRVDMNLIVDLDPVEFLNNGGAEDYVKQIRNVDSINLFLSSLIDVDTTLWKYPVPSWMKKRSQFDTRELESKVNKVCEKMRGLLMAEEDSSHYLLSILSTFAKENPPKLEEALSLIRSSAPQPTAQTNVLLSDTVQNAIKYLAFLADYQLIFDTACGMYDFEMAKAVARHSQLDPKIYLPMLKRWKELPHFMAKYEVDVKLKRYESALRNLVACYREESSTEEPQENQSLISPVVDFSQCLEFIEKHELHRLGLELFKRDDPEGHRSIMLSLGERLLADRKPDESLVIFLAANPKNLEGAKRAAKASGDWRTYCACCAEAGEVMQGELISDIVEKLSTDIGTERERQANFAAAARILLDYDQNTPDALDMFLSARMWGEGRRIAYLYDRIDLVNKVVDGSVSYARTCVEDLTERASSFTIANNRYAEVIIIRRDAIKNAQDIEDNLDDSASMFSVQSTASNTSLMSSASGASLGSVASVSTVITVGAQSTFSLTGDVDTMKHKSKFNKIGRDKKKSRKKKKGGPNSRRAKPGSEKELEELIATLKHTCPTEHYAGLIVSTIEFLLQSDKVTVGKLLFEAYQDLASSVEESQTCRIDKDKARRREQESRDRKEGRLHEATEHPCEKEINSIRCLPLKDSIRRSVDLL